MMRRVALLIATLILSLSGCAPPDEASEKSTAGNDSPAWPKTLTNFRFHWTAAPGIDLTTQPAVAIRAYLESYQIASMTFDKNNVYPGFLRATAENLPQTGNYLMQSVNVRPLSWLTGNPPPAVAQYGFQTQHLLELNRENDGYRAIVCTGEYSQFTAATSDATKFVSGGAAEVDGKVVPYPDGPYAGISVRQIALASTSAGENGGSSALQPQRGPSPAPDVDVFGTWFVSGASTSGWGPLQDPSSKAFPSAELLSRCAAAMPDDEAQRRAMMTGLKDQPPAAGNPIPGWPTNTS